MKPNADFQSPERRKEKGGGDGEAAGVGSGEGGGSGTARRSQKQKPPFRIAKDDSKPLLRDPILRSDPIETEQAVLRLPPLPLAAMSDLSKGIFPGAKSQEEEEKLW